MAEHVMERRAVLLVYLDEDKQVLFTTTDLNLFTPDFTGKADIWDVQGGAVTPRQQNR